MHLLLIENEILWGESMMRSNEIKTLKVMHISKTEEKESHIKEFQNKLRQANKIAADKTKELNKLKRDIVPDEQDVMLSCGWKSPSLRNKNDMSSTQNERNHEIDSLASDLEQFKKFVQKNYFLLKLVLKL